MTGLRDLEPDRRDMYYGLSIGTRWLTGFKSVHGAGIIFDE